MDQKWKMRNSSDPFNLNNPMERLRDFQRQNQIAEQQRQERRHAQEQQRFAQEQQRRAQEQQRRAQENSRRWHEQQEQQRRAQEQQRILQQQSESSLAWPGKPGKFAGSVAKSSQRGILGLIARLFRG